MLERLTQVTYFDRRELKLLYRAFMRAVAPARSISPDLFRRIFPEFDNPQLLRSVFNTFDVRERADDEISFSEFVEVLSVMVRGSMSERAHCKYFLNAATIMPELINFSGFSYLRSEQRRLS